MATVVKSLFAPKSAPAAKPPVDAALQRVIRLAASLAADVLCCEGQKPVFTLRGLDFVSPHPAAPFSRFVQQEIEAASKAMGAPRWTGDDVAGYLLELQVSDLPLYTYARTKTCQWKKGSPALWAELLAAIGLPPMQPLAHTVPASAAHLQELSQAMMTLHSLRKGSFVYQTEDPKKKLDLSLRVRGQRMSSQGPPGRLFSDAMIQQIEGAALKIASSQSLDFLPGQIEEIAGHFCEMQLTVMSDPQTEGAFFPLYAWLRLESSQVKLFLDKGSEQDLAFLIECLRWIGLPSPLSGEGWILKSLRDVPEDRSGAPAAAVAPSAPAPVPLLPAPMAANYEAYSKEMQSKLEASAPSLSSAAAMASVSPPSSGPGPSGSSPSVALEVAELYEVYLKNKSSS